MHRSELCHRGGVHACRDALLLPSLPELLPVQAEGTSRRIANRHEKERVGYNSQAQSTLAGDPASVLAVAGVLGGVRAHTSYA